MNTKFEWQAGLEKYVEAVAVAEPTPGGGSAAAAAGAIGCALGIMAVSTTLKFKKTPEDYKPDLQEALTTLSVNKDELESLSLKDALSYQNYINIKKASPEDTVSLNGSIDAASLPPRQVVHVCVSALKILKSVEDKVSHKIISDLYCGVHLLRAAVKCAAENIKINMTFTINPAVKKELQDTLSFAAAELKNK